MGMSSETINPESMGTTGLVQFVLDIRTDANGHSCRYNRLRKAVSVVRARHGDRAIIPFCKAIWAKVSTNIHDRRHFGKLLALFGFEAE